MSLCAARLRRAGSSSGLRLPGLRTGSRMKTRGRTASAAAIALLSLL